MRFSGEKWNTEMKERCKIHLQSLQDAQYTVCETVAIY
jgi:hypothetical protein